MPINELNYNTGVLGPLKPQGCGPLPVWKKVVPVAPRIDFFTGRPLVYMPKEIRQKENLAPQAPKQQGLFFKSLVSWINPLKPFEKPLEFAQKACKIAKQIPGISQEAEALSEALSNVEGVFSITACIETVASIEKRLNSQGLEEPIKMVKLMLSFLKGVTQSIQWMDQVGVVDLTKESEKNVKALGLFSSVSSSLMAFWEKVNSSFSYKQIFQSSFKALVAVLKLCIYLFNSQLTKIILKPLTIGGDLIKGGFALNDHYNNYAEGKDSWQVAMLRLGDTCASLALSGLALVGWYTQVTAVLPTLVIALSILQLGAQISIYLSS